MADISDGTLPDDNEARSVVSWRRILTSRMQALDLVQSVHG